MTKHPEWASSQDPRHLAKLYDERANTLRPVSHSFNAFYNNMPEEVKRRVLINRRIQRIHDQFSQVVDPFILEHTNSVYLLRHKDVLGDSQPNKDANKEQSDTQVFDLVVYVDNSLVAAELNARRELIRLKYREQFRISIDVFEIRISRGSYKGKYPFRNQDAVSQIDTQPRDLSDEENERINELVEDISDKRIKESFIKAITAQKRFLDEK
ncbi:MAG: hypothetical protein U0K14_03920 [Eggerthellaceae bacterium]|nr:hypothetical protein [Eggerthellaceae bacterium]